MCSSNDEKATFLVLFHYDINRGHVCNYDDIQRELERLGDNVVEFQANTWFVEAQLSASEISKQLRSNLSGAESLFVATLGSDVGFSGILPEGIAAIARRSHSV